MDDQETEGDEPVTVTLWSPGGYEIVDSGTATVVIHDDENAPPLVQLTAPATNAIFPQITNITLTATASDANGSVTNVEFFREGSLKLGEDASAPYAFIWSNAPPGSYVLTARATDNLGATADSAPVGIMVRGPPGVYLTSPVHGASFSATAGIAVNATATDPDGAIAFVELYRNGALLTATNGSVLSALWTNLPPGIYTNVAVACDDRALFSTSSAVVVTVNAAGLSDAYAGRAFLGGFTNYAGGNTATYSKEPGETNHNNRNGTRSGWVAWTAPASAPCTMDTLHVPSSGGFDTVLAVYTNVPGTDSVSNLIEVISNDDASGQTIFSKVTFAAVAGQSYAIAVDAWSAGAGGSVQLHIAQSNGAPVIVTPPQSQVAIVGDPVTFSVSASGDALNYQWRKNGAALTVTNASLVLSNVALGDSGRYDVVVSNPAGAVTSPPAVLAVRAAAQFVSAPAAQVVNPGGTATFSVTAAGSEPMNYQWSFNGVLLPGAVTNSFTRHNAHHADGGVYHVTVANAVGGAGAGAELIVRPVFTALTPSNDTLHLTWHGTTGKVYLVEATTNLSPPVTNWTVLGAVTNTALQGLFQVSLTNPPARLLRLRLGP
jgi:hypothetical protein